MSRRMLKMTALALAVVVLVGGLAGWMNRPWVPRAEMVDPGPAGRRIDEAGVLGNWHPANGPGRHPAVLMLGGSEGGIGKGGQRMALALQRGGYAVLRVSYFRAPGQSRTLENVPLETFDRAMAWLRRQPGVDPDRLAVVGASKGAEAALLVATRHPELRAVIAGMPSSVVWNGIDWEWTLFGAADEPSWSVGGKPMAAMPYRPFVPDQGPVSVYGNVLLAPSPNPAAAIPIERARADVLLICGEDDSLWPSCPMARQVAARARTRGGPTVELLAYPNAGHGVFGLPVPAADRERLANLGGTPDGNAAARDDGWPRTLAFLRARLG